MPTIDSLDRFLEGQFQAWSRQDVEHQNNRTGPVIAISREPGCGGKRIAQTIADALGLTLFDSNIIEQIATNAHFSKTFTGGRAHLGRVIARERFDFF